MNRQRRRQRTDVGWLARVAWWVGVWLYSSLALAQSEPPPPPQDPTQVPETILPPEVTAQAEPVYPPDCVQQGVQGDVDVEVDIGDDGLVTYARVLRTPDVRLGFAALGAIVQLQTIPARRVRGDVEEPIAVRIQTTLHFKLEEQATEREVSAQEAAALLQQAEAPINLRGRVIIKGTQRPLVGAHVFVMNSQQQDVASDTYTDERGDFSVRGVPAGVVRVLVEASGYVSGDVELTQQANEISDLVVYLEEKSTKMETVVRERRTQREVTKRVLTQKELTRIPGTFGDPIRAVQRLPGVARAPFGLGAVLVRGGSPEDSVILIDGHLSRVLFHLGAGPSVLNNDLVERLDFYPGGQGARFGRAIAGAIEVVTRDPHTDVYSAQATIDLLQTGFRLEGPLTSDGKVAFFMAGRASYVAEVLRVANRVGGGIANWFGANFTFLNLAPRYADYQAKLLWQMPQLLPHSKMSLVLNVLGSHDDLDFALDASQLGPGAPASVGITIGFHRLNPVWRLKSTIVNDEGTPTWQAYVSPLVELTYTQNRFDASQFGLDITRGSLRAELELRPVGALGVRVGVDGVLTRFTTIADLPNLRPTERLFPRPATSDPPRFFDQDEVIGSATAFYLDSDVHLGDLTLLLGARSELTTYYDQVRINLDPRFAFRWDLLRSVTFKGNLGRYTQSTTPFALSKGFGNPNLPLERGWQTGVGAEVWLRRSLDLDVQLFVRTANNLAESVGGATQFVSNGAPFIQPIGEERAYGAEFLLRQRLDNGFFGWISYTLLRAEERRNPAEGIAGSKGTSWVTTEFDQTHILSLAASTELPWGFELGGAFRYVTGNPTTFAQRGIFDGDTSGYRRLNGPARNDRLPAFIQLDARVDKKFVFDQWTLAMYLDLQNVTNQQNFEFFQYNYDFTQVQGFPGLPILPVFGAEASF
jgi:TonB family protein